MKFRQLSVLFAFLSTGAYGQWLDFPTPGIPRTPDGKPNLAAPAPSAADGKPDLSGVWMHDITPIAELRRLYGDRLIDDGIATQAVGMEIGTAQKYAINILIDFKREESPLRPETVEIMRQRAATRNLQNGCGSSLSFPLAGFLSEPIKIIQASRETVVLYEAGELHRQIFTDGRTLPKEVNLPAVLGYSAGHWERDVFVVETAGFNDKSPLDLSFHPHSEDLRITERFHRRDFGHMDVETTFDDPTMYSKPFTLNVPYTLLADTDIFEMSCTDNEKDAIHMLKK